MIRPSFKVMKSPSLFRGVSGPGSNLRTISLPGSSNLFLNPDVRSKYELNSYRKQNLLRLRKFINEVVIDQIPVLGELLRSLEELSMMGDSLPFKISSFVIQQLPEIQDKICYQQD